MLGASLWDGPDAEEIATAQATGARAFPVEIKEIASA